MMILLRELAGLFVDDGALALAILAVVGLAGTALGAYIVPPQRAGRTLPRATRGGDGRRPGQSAGRA